MEPLQPDETLPVGQWIADDGKAREDEVCDRIRWLLADHLERLASDQQSGWDTLYRDPDDGRYWEHTYPQSALHGGGPPQLRCMTIQEAQQKYGQP
jgi:hypothetical protein